MERVGVLGSLVAERRQGRLARRGEVGLCHRGPARQSADVLGRARTRPAPEHEEVREAVAAEAVGAVHAAGNLTGGVQAGDSRRRGVRVDLHPAHDVVAGGPDLHRLGGDVDVGQLLELVVHRGQAPGDLLCGETGRDVEEDAAVWCAAAGLDLAVDGPGDLVTRQQLGRPLVVLGVGVPAVRLLLGVGVLRAEDVRHVVEHEPLALGVAQDSPVAAHRLRHEDALDRRRPDHARRVELDELHVDQGGAGAQGERMAVAGVLPGVAGDLEGLADPAGGEDDRRRLEQHEPPRLAPVPEGTGDGAVLLEDLGDGQLGEDLQARLVVTGLAVVLLLEADDLLLQGADQLEAGAVTHMGKARVLVAAEVALADPPVGCAVEQGAVGLQLPDPVRGLLGVQLGHPRVVEELPAAHGVAEVRLPGVLLVRVAHGGGDPALGHDGVRLAEQRLADDGGPQSLLPSLDRRPQARSPGADDDDVVLVPLEVGHACSSAGGVRSVCRGAGWCGRAGWSGGLGGRAS